MQTSNRVKWAIRGSVMAVVVGLLSACESTNTETAMAVTPSSSTLAGVGATVVLEASVQVQATEDATNEVADLYLPLIWEVSNQSLGRIMSTAGYTAIYESNGKVGQNYITVQDQAGKEGTATVVQRETVETPPADAAP